MHALILSATGYIVRPQFSGNDDFGIELYTKVDMSLNKETEPT